VPLSDVDRKLLAHCFQRRLFAWESFVDRYLMLTVFVVRQTALRRQFDLTDDEVFELVSDVFLTLIRNDFELLRRFRGKSSLATYLTVLTRRVVVRKLLRMRRPARSPLHETLRRDSLESSLPRELDVVNVESLLRDLDPTQAAIVRMYHLERKSLAQIAESTNLTKEAVREQLTYALRKLRLDENANQGA
jgi:RNA polymerase sigma-70 factor (ECF subfamily)